MKSAKAYPLFFQAGEDHDKRLSKDEMLKHSMINVSVGSALLLMN